MGSMKQPQAHAEVPQAAQGIIGQMQSMVPQFSNMTLDPRIYSMTPIQQGAQNAGMSMFNSAIPNSINTLSGILSPGFTDPASNPNLANTLNMLNTQFQQGLGQSLDMLGSQFALNGMVPGRSSGFGGYGSNLARNALTDYTNNVGNILFGQYNTGVNQQLQGLNSLGMMPNALNSMSMLGAVPQQLAQTQQMGQLSLDQLPFGMLQQILQSMPLSYPSYGQSPFSQNMSALSSIMQALGSVGQGAGAIMGAI